MLLDASRVIAGVSLISLLGVIFTSYRRRRQHRRWRQPEIGDFNDIEQFDNHDEFFSSYNDDEEEEYFDDEIEVIDEVPEPIRKAPVPVNAQNIIVLNVFAKPNQEFIGYELLQALLTAGLRFGEMNIFHRHQEMSGRGPIIFSLLSATEPGTFNMQHMGSYSCSGLSLFMQLTGDEEQLNHLEIILNTARQLADDLDGLVLDDKREEITANKIAQLREMTQAQITG